MRLLLFTGQGGAGTTTMAAATAVHTARCGLRTLVLSADPVSSLAGVLAVQPAADPVQVTAGLYAQHLDPLARAQRSLDRLQPDLVGLLDQLGADPLAPAELAGLPGTQELLALFDVRDQLRHGDWDVVVLDCGASAPTLRLLALPELLARCVQRLLPMERRIDRIVDLHRTDRTRAGEPIPGDRVVEAAERFSTELDSLEQMLHATGTSVRLVLTPQASALDQTRRSWTALALHGFGVDEVIVNKVLPGGDDPWLRARAHAQDQVLADAAESFAAVPVRRSGYAAAEPSGIAALAALAADLYGQPSARAGADLLDAPDVPGAFQVDRDGGGFVLRVPVPFAARSDCELGRRGHDLVLTVSGERRTLTLPSALRRCDVDGAALRDGALAIRFVPDPSQWRPL